ncbi:hypothetical protein HID58_082131 [Brassica napus]|uniref:Uncharacterized protein n=1 Tax=Brassica napus TaxID=3708 RepID=A0ABQ7Y9M9_BRANA|nr:hypothetical protein HID58_082131 [Brassica napus]
MSTALRFVNFICIPFPRCYLISLKFSLLLASLEALISVMFATLGLDSVFLCFHRALVLFIQSFVVLRWHGRLALVCEVLLTS